MSEFISSVRCKTCTLKLKQFIENIGGKITEYDDEFDIYVPPRFTFSINMVRNRTGTALETQFAILRRGTKFHVICASFCHDGEITIFG